MKTPSHYFSWSIMLTVAALLVLTTCRKTVEDEVTPDTTDQLVLKGAYKLPHVHTITVSENTTGHSVKTGVTVSLGKGSPPVTECGIILCPTHMAVLNEENSDHIVLGDTTGTFLTIIDNLDSNQCYFFRGYAINSEGIAYDTYDVVSVTTVRSNLTCPDFINYEGHAYPVVQIGGQCWMAENLNVGSMIPGGQDADPTNSSIEKYCYNNNEANCEVYGALYQWDEMMQSADPSVTNPSGVKGICPEDWHLPSFSEISQLTNFLGGTYDGGGTLKEVGTQHWLKKNVGATDEYNFTSLGSGYYSTYSNSFRNLKVMTHYWSTTTHSNPHEPGNYAWTFMHEYNSSAQFHFYVKRDEMSSYAVRCVMDYPSETK